MVSFTGAVFFCCFMAAFSSLCKWFVVRLVILFFSSLCISLGYFSCENFLMFLHSGL